MSGAVNAVTCGELKPSEAVINFVVPHQTLRDRLTGRIVHGTNPILKPYLTKQREEILADHLILIAAKQLNYLWMNSEMPGSWLAAWYSSAPR